MLVERVAEVTEDGPAASGAGKISVLAGLCYTDGVSIAAFQPIAIVVFVVCAVVSMVFAALAERRGSAAATGLRRLGVVCAVLAAVSYAVPMAALVQ